MGDHLWLGRDETIKLSEWPLVTGQGCDNQNEWVTPCGWAGANKLNWMTDLLWPRRAETYWMGDPLWPFWLGRGERIESIGWPFCGWAGVRYSNWIGEPLRLGRGEILELNRRPLVFGQRWENQIGWRTPCGWVGVRYSRCLVDPVNSRRTDSHGGGGTTGALICVHEILREKKTSVFTKYTLHVKKKKKKKEEKGRNMWFSRCYRELRTENKWLKLN